MPFAIYTGSMSSGAQPWPSLFDALRRRLEEAGPMVVLSETWETKFPLGICARTLTCGLVGETAYNTVSDAEEDELGHEVSSSGPHPWPRSGYEPGFWIHGGRAIPDDVEPLVLSWTSNNRTVHEPDPGFLMTYGLVPRLVPGNRKLHWDDPEIPLHDVVVVAPVSEYEHFNQTEGGVQAKRTYVQDYASLRGSAIVCVFYERWLVDGNEEIRTLLGDQRYREWRQRDAYFRCQRIVGKDDSFHVDVWGHRLIMRPGPFPVSARDAQYGTLTWPGIDEPVTGDSWRGYGPADYVYVKDDVLGEFEGRAEYSIHPNSGAVSYGGQWQAGFCDRVGRDMIRLEIKKLYEGTPPHVVRHYHKFVIEKPPGEVQELLSASNVGTRAKKIVYQLAGLGEALAKLVSVILGEQVAERHTFDLPAPRSVPLVSPEVCGAIRFSIASPIRPCPRPEATRSPL